MGHKRIVNEAQQFIEHKRETIMDRTKANDEEVLFQHERAWGVAIWFVLVALFFLQGCANVSALDREVLAKAEMALTTDAIEAATDDHIYFSKEASSGGRAFGGGGCGCN